MSSVPHSNTPPAPTLDQLQDTAGTSTEVSQGIPEGAQQLQSSWGISSWAPWKSLCFKRFKTGPSNPVRTWSAFPPESLRNFRADYTRHNSFSIYLYWESLSSSIWFREKIQNILQDTTGAHACFLCSYLNLFFIVYFFNCILIAFKEIYAYA